MSQLGAHYRFQVLNQCGQTIAAGDNIVVKVRRWKYASDGSIVFESAAATQLSTGNIVNGAYATGSTVDNSSDKYLGATIEFTVTAPASASGPVRLFLQRSVDGGTTWGDDGAGQELRAIQFTTSGTQRRVVHL